MEKTSQLLLTCLLNACWMIALIAAIASVSSRLLRPAAARHRHLLWLVALALSLCLPMITNLRFSASAAATPPAQTDVPMQLAGPVDATLMSNEGPAPLIPVSSSLAMGRNVALGLALIYLLFVCYRGFSLYRAWRSTRRIARTATEIELPEDVYRIVERCRTILNLDRVRILSAPFVTVPITLGFVDPLVILPERLLFETDRDLLTSAIGHELVHVLRRDYALNLLYEFFYLPLSFHPAAALVRRRIRETRELSCDELVADKLLAAEVYARSLVQLAGSAMALSRNTTVTVGIADADILEERVMRMLRRPTIDARRKSLLLVASLLLLSLPCLAAVPLALRVNIASPEVEPSPQQLVAQAEILRSEIVIPQMGADTQPGTLAVWLKKPGDAVERGDVVAKVNTSKGVINITSSATGVVEQLLVPVGQIAAAGDVLAIVRPHLSTGDGMYKSSDAGLTWKLEPDLLSAEQEQEQRAQDELLLILQAQRDRERQLRHTGTPQDLAEQEAKLKATQRLLEKVQADGERRRTAYTVSTADGGTVTISRADQEQQEREKEVRGWANRADRDLVLRERIHAARELAALDRAELAKQATVSMQQAIQIATTQYPGTVLDSRLVRERSQACYVLSIISENGTVTTVTRIMLSAVDGSVLNVVKEER